MKKLALLFTLVVVPISSHSQTGAATRPRILGIDHVSFYTTAPDGARKLYADLLGLAAAAPLNPARRRAT